ncbi:DUF937 domain-containing protein [Phreatobacter oligotrophus]|jgi:hypothetical protein|uniref:DUF937 domain-containing protein n=1 Tax=Phreatobacter oligotrophus TaxID=1122261 RepID=UPI0023535BCB|nr:DUF937 domain-containing protein [Phreatobacter oligotrophus]MBX9991681.1 DUF937 domain-containing protein [Phreatobacter oligotrophus]
MFNLAEILAQAQKQQGFDQMAAQFGMGAQQMKTAMDALLPAFSLGLNRATQSPMDMAQLFGLFASGTNYAQMFEQPMAAGQAMMTAGQQALGRIFGPELSQAIAQQTAVATGFQQEAMKQVMPVMASMLMGGLMKGAMAGQNPLGEMITAMVAKMMPPQSTAAADPVGGMMGMFGNFFPQAGKTAGAMPPIPGLEQMMELGRQMQAANPLLAAAMAPPQPAAGEATGPRSLGQQAADTWTATMGRMFEAGREVQDQQLAQLEGLFAQFGKAPKADQA